ncbi:ubiquitin carboxyl-terminal hydrolase 36/42 [Elysia marginata]|uniref:Ubiquitin carboxyl-terminal hydrolase 36/42 n=1 Tax=Elysia marginata TaxID=1093978 RepID=A0AAV4GS36_9GAST|nr:ubiquitin carboxyl-terminal hydrolase 36/42 [Elysia marginata]
MQAPTAPDEPETYDPDFVPRHFGLNNAGVICHLNSLLQGIVGCSAVVRAAVASRGYLGKTATGRAFYDFIWEAVPASRPSGEGPFVAGVALEDRSAEVLHALVADLRNRRPRFRYGPGQESASEGLALLLDMLTAPELVCEENPIARLFYHRYQAVVYCKNCKKSVSEELDVAVQFNLFHFDGLQKKPCTPTEFGEMLRSQVSFLENYRCGECGQKAGGFRHYQLRMVPEVLVALFNVYHRRQARYTPTRVRFPGLKGAQLIYRQVAQIEQFGSLAGGHYSARGLRADGKVYRLNDSSAELSCFDPTPDVYMVFYHCEQIFKAARPDSSTH